MKKIMISLRKAKREEKKGKEEGLNYGRLTVKWNRTCWYHEDYGHNNKQSLQKRSWRPFLVLIMKNDDVTCDTISFLWMRIVIGSNEIYIICKVRS